MRVYSCVYSRHATQLGRTREGVHVWRRAGAPCQGRGTRLTSLRDPNECAAAGYVHLTVRGFSWTLCRSSLATLATWRLRNARCACRASPSQTMMARNGSWTASSASARSVRRPKRQTVAAATGTHAPTPVEQHGALGGQSAAAAGDAASAGGDGESVAASPPSSAVIHIFVLYFDTTSVNIYSPVMDEG
jgi:hypothetical protein